MTIRKSKRFKNQAIGNRTFKIVHFSTIKRMTYSNHPTDCIELFMSFSENEKKERSILGFKSITISLKMFFEIRIETLTVFGQVLLLTVKTQEKLMNFISFPILRIWRLFTSKNINQFGR